jgi:hypothetical protein
MAKKVYLKEIHKTTSDHAYVDYTLSQIKKEYDESVDWKTFYIRRNGKRYLFAEKNGEIKIFSYESDIGMV